MDSNQLWKFLWKRVLEWSHEQWSMIGISVYLSKRLLWHVVLFDFIGWYFYVRKKIVFYSKISELWFDPLVTWRLI